MLMINCDDTAYNAMVHYVEKLEAENKQLRLNATHGTGKPCACGNRMIPLPSQQQRVCCCGHKEPFVLKKGKKSVLIDGLVGN